MKTDYTLYILKPDKRTQMGERIVSTTVWYDRDDAGMKREVAELLDIAPLTLDNFYNIFDLENGTARAHLLTDKLLFDTQTVQEVCNLMHLRQLGCSTGTLQDFGPDFGVSYILDGLQAMGQKSYAVEDHE
jgi:hypothetical protein